METKARRNNVEILRRKLRFDRVFVVEANGRSGRLALFWKNSVVVQVLDSCANFIHSAIQLSSQGLVFLMTFMYGHPDFSDRRHLWPIISNLNHDTEVPWSCIGDMNEILHQSEKDGVRPHSNLQIEEFRNFLDSAGFSDMALQGGRFTWCNNRDYGCVRERIDRCLFNEAWNFLFPSAWLETVPVVESDHSPLILRFCKPPSKSGKFFKFEQFWLENDECLPIIQEAWQETNSSDGLRAISHKINEVSAKLQVWEKNTFKRADKEIIILRKILSDLSNDVSLEGRIDQVRCIKRQFADLRKQEEQFWESRARVKWLRSGDKNTRFFHTVTMQRRNINRISSIQLSNGEWEIDEARILEVFPGFYSDLFTSINPPDPSFRLASFPVRVSNAMNSALMARVSMDELKSAVFGLGALKAPGPDGMNGLFFQKGWDFMKSDLLSATHQFMEGFNSSWCWSSLLDGIDFIKTNLSWVVKDGLSINIWGDYWLPTHAKIPYCTALSRDANVASLIRPNGGGWDTQKILGIFYRATAEPILSIPLPWLGGDDYRIWHFNSNGEYLVKSGYWVAFNSNPNLSCSGSSSSFNLDPLLWKWIWNLQVPNKARNNFYFNQSALNPSAVIISVAEKAHEFMECTLNYFPEATPSSLSASVARTWALNGFYRCNVDADFQESSHLCALTFVLRDDRGALLTGSVNRFWSASPLVAEALALREGICACANLSLEGVYFETDCQVLYEALLGDSIPWVIEPIIADIKSLLQQNLSFSVHWILRSLNVVADWVARRALKQTLPPLWSIFPPVDLKRLLEVSL
ncbi:reverse transcriptase [Senna tora]|uniref:Reverse transcriptase n=1 Tax=Senna tora TaxID=362788 RepID=A0A834TP85_9FABA|nr:reverse transcriptase [Senna tora]